ncbi:MAG: hypothetical protein WEE89_18310 [Gemmatimonadota bacterium]
MKIRFPLALAAAMAAPFSVAAQEHQHAGGELGTVAFPVTCSAAAQTQMHRAVAMLHSFWFPEARKTFEAAATADPSCGIAYWGVALSHFGNPMAGGSTGPSQGAGWQAAQKGLQAGARSERDRAYIEAAAALFRDHDKVDARTRMRAYEAAMQSIVQRYPQDIEAKIFHGIFMVATAPPTDLTFAQQKKAADILIPLYKQQPNHPGLAHYIIHAFDSPQLADRALEAARVYANIAPAAPHAQHMPSHIFTRLGFWDESIKTNRRSADLEPTPGAKSHAGDYMVYAYLQQGRDEQALKIIQDIAGATPSDYTPAGALASYNGLAMLARYALERDDWKAAAALKLKTTTPSAEAVTHFAKGLGAARSGDVAAAKQEVAALEKNIADLVAAKDVYWPIIVDAQRLAIASWIAHAEGRHQEALQLARQAADKEEEVEKHPVTPGPLIPARELLGDILMVHRQPADALAAYEATLKREPNRARTLAGAARAAKAAGKEDVAKKYYKELIALMDPLSTRPELKEAKQIVLEERW